VRANHSFALNKNTRHFFSSDFGICGSALGWLQSFVTGRYQYVAVGAQKFLKTICASGIPQGSEFSPLLFAMYILPISNVVTAHSLDHHQYADDTQLYMTVRPSALTAVSECVEDVARWFLENGLLLNPAKTEAVLFGTKAQRDKIPSARGIDITGTVVPFRNSVKLLGVTLDSVLTMDRHVTEVIRSCSYHTRALRHIRPLLTLDVAKMISHSIVISAGLRQRTAARHVGLQHQQAAGGAKFVGQDSLSSPSASQCHRVASSASLAASSTADFLPGRCHHLQDTFHQQTGLPL